jgi:hypothetical protein
MPSSSSDPYYKCNAVSIEEEANLTEQGAIFADTAVGTMNIGWFYFKAFLLIVLFIGLNMSLPVDKAKKHGLILMGVFGLILFILLILLFTGIVRDEGFKGRRKHKPNKKPSHKKQHLTQSTINKNVVHKDNMQNYNKKKSNFAQETIGLIAVGCVMITGTLARIGYLYYQQH